MYNKKLSIIIPTKNRQQYALNCIKTLLNFSSNGFEVVVQDNSDDDSLGKMLGSLIDNDRLRYQYTPECLSFCTNFEKGIELSTGDYLVMIGDDDCVFPEIVDLTDIAREKNVDSVVFPTKTTYIWPNAVSQNAGKLVVRKQRNYIKKLSTSTAIEKMASKGYYDYQQYPFPKIYHGIVKREKFDAVKEKTGHYFGGLTPDIYSAVALSFYIDDILYINTPFTLPGTCAKSGSADSLTGRHTGELKDAPHFRGHDHYEWDVNIPYVYTVDTIWAESAFKAIKENGGTIELSNQEYFEFLTHIVKKCSDFKDRMVDFYSCRTGEDKEKISLRLDRAVSKLKRHQKIKKYFMTAKQVLLGRYVYRNIDNIESAVQVSKSKIRNYKKVIESVKRFNW